jgi:MFS transporter, FHS family, glucose/mannose:H+ symporter
MRTRIPFYAGFAATGVSVAIPGAMMPWLLTRWTMDDAQAGLLFFLFFLGSTSGAALSRGSLQRSIIRGTACTALAAALLPFAAHWAAYAAMLFYGFGLGITMTSISLLHSRRAADNCVAEMTRLNLLWAAGACMGPWLALRDGAHSGAQPTRVLLSLAAFFGALALWFMLAESDSPLPHIFVAADTGRGIWAISLTVLLLIFCSTGVESSAGGWLATYSQRSGHSLGTTIGAPTCLWTGLLLSRLLHSSARFGRASLRYLLTWNLVILTAALVVLMLSNASLIILAASFTIGLAIGPVYPMMLALAFERSSSSLIFVVAGFGSALLPLLTGALSTATGSLSIGLAAPAFAALAMTVSAWLTWKSRCAAMR